MTRVSSVCASVSTTLDAELLLGAKWGAQTLFALLLTPSMTSIISMVAGSCRHPCAFPLQTCD